jgi:hypothetical protein
MLERFHCSIRVADSMQDLHGVGADICGGNAQMFHHQ